MRVLVLDEGFMSGTVTARALRHAGCDVDVIAATGGRGTCAQGAGTWRLGPRAGTPALLDAVSRAAHANAYDVIFPVTEPLQRMIWDACPDWQGLVFPEVPERHRAARLDKRVMSDLVAASGVRIPRQMPAGSHLQIGAAIRALGLPIVIKGNRGRGGNCSSICDGLDDARGAAARIENRGVTPFAQEYIRGATYLAGALCTEGRLLRFYTGIKSVQYPPRVGPAAVITSVYESALHAAAATVFTTANVTGLASLDFVRDDSGTFHFLELNPRPWGSIEAAASAGAALFEGLVDLWRSHPVTPHLGFQHGVRTPIYPLYALAASDWRPRALNRSLIPAARRAISLARDEPALLRHVVHRLVRAGINSGINW